MKDKDLSVFLSYILRHKPEEIGLEMDTHGWVDTESLIRNINSKSKYRITSDILSRIVEEDSKQRYKFNEDKSRIKACQGHSIPYVQPELTIRKPPDKLYHGTTTMAYGKIMASGAILKMKRHAVHMQSCATKAWESAIRWNKVPVVLVIDAMKMFDDGYEFGVSDNDVWCVEEVPTEYICGLIFSNDQLNNQ